ncbi:QueT transporter family protein [Metabacillus fastidiosus]|uniref:QueT transporter family protein n=1 Tax=Metabacillus fastidiosus TaxID=1458 RepID=A0ABU6P2J7_9BACI|nr:QueT transporter family protein [Metabacillus fastidiosus]MED4403559.1 QueT transporter family protein [Metabacillus fastidiosus]MED4455651.1 QueT transporter family protein [Metabacillus fastidiosus]MED4463715.1 QueT transporter family protein [Metabacillus fastidiosus]
MKVKTLVVNGLLAAIYIVVTMLIQPIGFGNIQFRIPEIFNHLIVFNKKYIYGILLGVFLANLFFSPMKVDVIFGVGQSLIALLITIVTARYIKGIWMRMFINTIVFSFTMFIIAFELYIFTDLDLPFSLLWLTTAIGEFVVMFAGAPIIIAINKRIHFEKIID